MRQPVVHIYSLLLTSIDASQRSVHLTMAYSAPGDDMIDAQTCASCCPR